MNPDSRVSNPGSLTVESPVLTSSVSVQSAARKITAGAPHESRIPNPESRLSA